MIVIAIKPLPYTNNTERKIKTVLTPNDLIMASVLSCLYTSRSFFSFERTSITNPDNNSRIIVSSAKFVLNTAKNLGSTYEEKIASTGTSNLSSARKYNAVRAREMTTIINPVILYLYDSSNFSDC